MKKIHIHRLTKYAKHLESITNHPEHGLYREVIIYAYSAGVRIHLEVKCHHWVFDALVDCFPEPWGYHEVTGDVVLESMGPEADTANSVCEFFGIGDYKLFCHLFDLDGHQSIEIFGGQKLNEDSSGPDIAKNILASVKCI